MTYHLISEDAVDAMFVKGDHPVEAAHLVVSHFTALHVCETQPNIVSKPNDTLQIATIKQYLQ